MAAGRHTFILEQGSTFDIRVEYKNNDNTPINLTNYQARMHIRPNATSPTIYARLTTTPTADGTGITMTPKSGSTVLPISSGSMGIYISAFSSSMFTFQEAYYDLEIYSGSGVTEYVTRVLEGKVKIDRNVTR